MYKEKDKNTVVNDWMVERVSPNPWMFLMCSLTKCVILYAFFLHRPIITTADNDLQNATERKIELSIVPEDSNRVSSSWLQ